MNKKRTKAFTLTELLVVVIVLGVLAAVAVPKFTRVLETRRTTEAENMLSAVRTEQEKRCSLGQNYTGDFGKIETVAYARTGEGQAQSANYTYALTATGASASREGKEYVLKMPSYKSGEICCEGEGCESLNKSYRPCSEVTVEVDECAATDVVIPEPEPSGPCDIDPDSCECNPNQAKCCGADEEWNGSACEPKDECEESVGSASSATASTVDTCDGNRTGKFTCDGHFKGTCTDVYANSLQAHVDENGALVSGVAKLASYEKDPFMAFKDSILLAFGSCSPGYTPCPRLGSSANNCCPSGYYCEGAGTATATCVKGQGPVGGNFCQIGYHWDAKQNKCVKDWEIEAPSQHFCLVGEHWDEAQGKCVKDEEEEETDCPEGYVWNASLGRCIKVVATLYMKREVTCCGDGQTVEKPAEPDPEPEPEEKDCTGTKPSDSQSTCNGCGTRTVSYECDRSTGKWTARISECNKTPQECGSLCGTSSQQCTPGQTDNTGGTSCKAGRGIPKKISTAIRYGNDCNTGGLCGGMCRRSTSMNDPVLADPTIGGSSGTNNMPCECDIYQWVSGRFCNSKCEWVNNGCSQYCNKGGSGGGGGGGSPCKTNSYVYSVVTTGGNMETLRCTVTEYNCGGNKFSTDSCS